MGDPDPDSSSQGCRDCEEAGCRDNTERGWVNPLRLTCQGSALSPDKNIIIFFPVTDVPSPLLATLEPPVVTTRAHTQGHSRTGKKGPCSVLRLQGSLTLPSGH